jgi:hypothetical protein
MVLTMPSRDDVTEPWKDPIVEEVRSVREQLLAACEFDLDKLAAHLR